MITLTLSLDSLAVYLVVIDIVVLLSYILFIFHKKRKLERKIAKVSEFVTDYFLNSAISVKVTSYQKSDDKHFITMIESQPLKRFRYSSVIERNLIDHIDSVMGIQIDRIYWRFPLHMQSNPMLEHPSDEDIYLNESEDATHILDDYKVSEVGWDDFSESNSPLKK